MVLKGNLGIMYKQGNGVQEDCNTASKWFRKSAEAGNTDAQFMLGVMYITGEGVKENSAKGLNWLQLSAQQGNKEALQSLDMMQQGNFFSTPPPGTAVTTILLTSANASKHNNKTGKVVEPIKGAAPDPGCAAVQLDSEAAPILIKLMNLKLEV